MLTVRNGLVWLSVLLVLVAFFDSARPSVSQAIGQVIGNESQGVIVLELSDHALEERARELGRKIRCLVCDSQSVEDSKALLAADIRNLIRERLSLGQSEEQIVSFLVLRYGEGILLDPPKNTQTALLWLTPFLVLAFGLMLVFRASRETDRASRKTKRTKG